METLLILLLLRAPEPLEFDRPAVLETYEDPEPFPWGVRDWDHEA